MINELSLQIERMEMTGFHASITGPSEVTFSSGTLRHLSGGKIDEWQIESVSFDIEPDPELPVMYRLYLLDDGSVELERTEIGRDNQPFYRGEGIIIHTLSDIRVPPAATIEQVEIDVRRITADPAMAEEKGGTGNEDQSAPQ